MLLSSEIALHVTSYLLSETEAKEALVFLMGQGAGTLEKIFYSQQFCCLSCPIYL